MIALRHLVHLFHSQAPGNRCSEGDLWTQHKPRDWDIWTVISIRLKGVEKAEGVSLFAACWHSRPSSRKRDGRRDETDEWGDEDSEMNNAAESSTTTLRLRVMVSSVGAD